MGQTEQLLLQQPVCSSATLGFHLEHPVNSWTPPEAACPAPVPKSHCSLGAAPLQQLESVSEDTQAGCESQGKQNESINGTSGQISHRWKETKSPSCSERNGSSWNKAPEAAPGRREQAAWAQPPAVFPSFVPGQGLGSCCARRRHGDFFPHGETGCTGNVELGAHGPPWSS